MLIPNGEDKVNTSKYELTGYINDINRQHTQVLMEYSELGFNGTYTYGMSRESMVIDGYKGYYQYDGRTSVANITGQDGDTMVSYTYTTFGVDTTFPASKQPYVKNPYRYNGEYIDFIHGAPDLQYLRARYYDAAEGRFTTRDTVWGKIEVPLSQNLYVYVGNNPILYTDPSGNVWVIEDSSGLYSEMEVPDNWLNWSSYSTASNPKTAASADFQNYIYQEFGMLYKDYQVNVDADYQNYVMNEKFVMAKAAGITADPIIKQMAHKNIFDSRVTNAYINKLVAESMQNSHRVTCDSLNFLVSTHRGIINKFKELTQNIDFARSFGLSGSAVLGLGEFSGSIGITVDSDGNIVYQASGVGGFTTGAGSFGGAVGMYDKFAYTPSYEEMAGEGYSLGGSVGVPYIVPIVVGVDLNLYKSNEGPYGDITIFRGIGTPGVEGHVLWGNTYNVFEAFNVYSFLDSAYNSWDSAYKNGNISFEEKW